MATAPRQPLLIALGDSLTEGRGDPGPSGRWVGWVRRMTDLLRLDPRLVLNLGSYQARCADVLTQQVPVALARRPLVVSAVIGGNDVLAGCSPDCVATDLAQIFQRLRTLHATVLTCTCPDIAARLPVPAGDRARLRIRLDTINSRIRELAAATGASCLDLATAPESSYPAFWSTDGLHPSPLGHQRIAEAVAEHVAPVLTAAGVDLAGLPPTFRGEVGLVPHHPIWPQPAGDDGDGNRVPGHPGHDSRQ